MVYYNATSHSGTVVDFRETAPSRAFKGMFSFNPNKAALGQCNHSCIATFVGYIYIAQPIRGSLITCLQQPPSGRASCLKQLLEL